VSDSDQVLDFACELAETNGSHLELIHVVDLVCAPSTPDAQAGIECRLNMLARRLTHLKRKVTTTLLFGSPEHVIPRRAADIKAKLILFALKPSSSAEVQQGQARRLMCKVACPVVILPGTIA